MFSLKILLFKLYALKLKIATTIKKKKKKKGKPSKRNYFTQPHDLLDNHKQIFKEYRFSQGRVTCMT